MLAVASTLLMRSQKRLFHRRNSLILTKEEKRDLLTHLRVVQYIRESGKEGSEMDLVSNSGLTVQSISENGEKIELTVKDSSCTLMVTFTMVNGQTIKPMAMAFTCM